MCGTAADLWSVYSKPVPANGSELRTLFLQCSCAAAVVGGLFYNWMFASLEYSWHLSRAMAVSFSLLLLLTLFLVHPARCVFSMIMPMLGTKQGRKLLLSTCTMIVVVNVTPNIISNIKTILQVIQCICKNSSESLLNSTALLETASWEVGNAIQETVDLIYRPMNGHFQFSVLKNSSLIYQQMHLAGERIGRDFLAVEVLVKDSVQVGNKLVACFSMLYLCFESSWYLKNYLTNLRFDNFYITKKLELLAVDRKATHLLVGSSKNLIRPTGLKLSREEVMLCLVQAMLLTVALLLMLVVVAMDHFAFSVADTAVRKAAQFSVVPVSLSIKYSVSAGPLSLPAACCRRRQRRLQSSLPYFTFLTSLPSSQLDKQCNMGGGGRGRTSVAPSSAPNSSTYPLHIRAPLKRGGERIVPHTSDTASTWQSDIPVSPGP